MTVTINGTTGISPVTAAGTSALVDGMTVGRGAGEVSTNTAVGASALASGSQSGVGTTAIGANALGVNTSGDQNTAIGQYALGANTTGSYNVAVGRTTLYSNTVASSNTAVGWQAGYSEVQGGYNTFIGYGAGYAANPATAINTFNTCVGAQAGYGLTTGTYNTFVGPYSSGSAITTGGKNTVLGGYNGNQGGLDIRTASNYIVLSDGDGNPRMYANSAAWAIPTGGTLTLNPAGGGAGLGGAVVIRQASGSARIDQYNDSSSTLGVQYFYYNAVEKGSITVSSTATAYNTSSDYRLKNSVAPMTGALAKLELLKPCTYKWNADGSDGEGFIAHELAEVCPQAVHGEKDAVDENGKPQYQGIDVSFLVATLTAAIQELKAEFDAYKEAHP